MQGYVDRTFKGGVEMKEFICLIPVCVTTVAAMNCILTGVTQAAPAPVQNSPLQPNPAIIAAWEKAGGLFGWISGHQGSRWEFRVEHNGDAALPAFRFLLLSSRELKSLPFPEVPFGLWLETAQVTDTDLEALSGFRQLQALNIQFTKVTGLGLKSLDGLPRFHYLRMSASTSDVVKHLVALKQLRSLSIGGSGMTELRLEQLVQLKELRSLDLGYGKVTSKIIKQLTGMTQLQSLSLRGSEVKDDVLQE